MSTKYVKILSLITELNNEKLSKHGQITLTALFNEVKAFNEDYNSLELEKDLATLKGMEK